MADRGRIPQAPTSRKGIRSLPEISFHRGMNSLKVNRLLLEQGECGTLLNPDFDVFGGMGIEKTIATVKSGYGAIHSLYASKDLIWIGHGTSLSYYNKDTAATVVVITGLSGNPLSMEVVGNFLYVSNGTDRKKVYLPTFAVSTWGIAAPTAAPVVTSGLSGAVTGVQTSTPGMGAVQGGNFVSSTGQNFAALGVAVGMTVSNDTTGASMTITAISWFMFSGDWLFGTLTGGSRQTWEHGDVATIDPGGLAIASVCQAYIGEHGSYVDNAGRDLYALGVRVGMTVRNVPRSTEFVITSISTTTATNDTLNSATSDMFHHGEAASINYSVTSELDGTYQCYYSYVAKYADGTEYETDLSPVATVALQTSLLTWTLPGSAADPQITHLRLYRDKLGLSQALDTLRENVEAEEKARLATMAGLAAGIFRGNLGGTFGGLGAAVKTVLNRTSNKKSVQDSVTDQNIIVGPFEVAEVTIATASYDDNIPDETLQENMPSLRERYLPVNSYTRILHRGKRIFGIGVSDYPRHLWYGNPYEPQALESSWDGYNTTIFEDDDNVSLHELGGHIYIGANSGFKRLRGATPGEFSLDDTPSTVGPESHDTCQVTPIGLMFPRRDGMYLFSGYTSGIIAHQVKNLLAQVNWNAIAAARSVWDGRFYRLFYPAGGATTNNRELTLDFIGGLKDVRAGEGNRAISAVVFDKATQTVYYGTSGGVLGTAAGAGSRSFEITTKEYVSADLLSSGSIGVLHYDLDTKGEDVTVTPIYDGVDQAPIVLNTDGRTKSQESLPKGNFYRLGFRIAATTNKDMVLYEPWLLE